MEGTAACILNAANEITVEAFLNDKIKFLAIAEINEKTLLNVDSVQKPAYEDYVESDKLAREYALSLIQNN